METLSEAQDDSSGARSSIKSEDGSPPPDGDRGSPPPNCAICLGRCRNKSFTDSCLHQFCFKCLLTWSRVKTECPLCKQNFKSIIHNVQSNQQYEEYRVEQRRQEEDRIDIDDLVTATRRFRYRTTLTFPRGGEHLALQRLLMHYPPLSAMVGMPRDLPGITPAALPSSRRRRSPSSFRRTVYRHNLWARPLPDFTGRHRDCTPEFYRYNDSQMHRLVPWLNRELHYLLLENAGHIAYVLQRILELLPQYHITSPEFREEMYRYFGSRTNHFLHELHCFASTPYDLTGYDRNVQYTTDSRISNTINNVISSSDTESGDSDIVEVLVTPPLHHTRTTPPISYRPVTPILPSPYEPNPGPSVRRPPDPVYPQNLITSPIEAARLARTVIPIETISHSDTDDDEVMVTGYIKPPHQRTPEVVDLRDSDDSDVVMTEAPPPVRYGHGPVQLTLSRPRALSATDSDGYTPPRASGTCSSGSSRSTWTRSSSSHASSPRTPALPVPAADAYDSDDEAIINLRRGADFALRYQKRERSTRQRRTRRSRETEREAATASVPAAPTSPVAGPVTSSNDASSPEADRYEHKRKKSKSTNGKGVKSSRKNESTTESRRTEPAMEVEPRPGPSSQSSEMGQKSSRKDDTVESSRRPETATEVEESRPGQSYRSSGKGPRSRRAVSTELLRIPESITEVDEPRPGPSSRPSGSKGQKSSRRDDAPESSKRAESIMEVDEPRPGPSSRPSGSKSQKSSRSHDTTESSKKSETSSKFQEEARPGPFSRPSGKGQKSSRRDDATEFSKRPETTLDNEESRPGSSSRASGKGQKLYRKDSIESSRKTESTTEVQKEPRAGPSSARSSGKNQKSSRRDNVREPSRRCETTTEIEEPRPGPSSRPKGLKLSRKYDITDSRNTESTTEIQEESRAGPSSRPSSKEVKLSWREDTSEPSISGTSSLKRKTPEWIPPRRNSRDIKRLKSVVKKASGSNSSVPAASSTGRPSSLVVRPSSSTVRSSSSAGAGSRKSRNKRSSSSSSASASRTPRSPDFTDSDDDIPLNLTIQRSTGQS